MAYSNLICLKIVSVWPRLDLKQFRIKYKQWTTNSKTSVFSLVQWWIKIWWSAPPRGLKGELFIRTHAQTHNPSAGAYPSWQEESSTPSQIQKPFILNLTDLDHMTHHPEKKHILHTQTGPHSRPLLVIWAFCSDNEKGRKISSTFLTTCLEII